MDLPRASALHRTEAIAARIRSVVRHRIGIDSRALAVFRMGLGLVLLADLFLRARFLPAFYTDAGVLPRPLLVDSYPFARYSLHALSGAAWFEGLLFLIAGGAAVALLAGYRTTVATVVSLVLLYSLHARNPFVLNGGDTLLRRLLFWGVFLPLGRRWSIDARGWAPSDRPVRTVASAALLLQMLLVYVTTAAFKLRGDLWVSGEAIPYLFRVDHLTFFLGDAIAGFPVVLRVLTWLWLGLLLAAPLLLVFTGWRRSALASVFILMHLGMGLTMQIGLFPLITVLGVLPFLHSTVWDRFERLVVDPVRARLPRAGRATPFTDPHPPAHRDSPDGVGLFEPRPPIPDGGDKGRRTVLTAVVSVLLVSSIAWNAMGLGVVATPAALAAIRDPADHQWDMFAQGRRSDGWFVASGRLENGSRVDPYARSAVSFDRPPELAATFPSSRWLKYSHAVRANQAIADGFAGYLCSRWNRRHDVELSSVTVSFMRIPIRVDGSGPMNRVTLARTAC